ncbi:MAG TPA: hypothetical protein VGL40_14280, partial [Bacillota bacterium]
MRRSRTIRTRALVAGLVIALLIATMLAGAAGCSKSKLQPKADFIPFPTKQPGTTAPKPPQGTAERPALVSVRVGIGEYEAASGESIADAMFYGSAKAIVGTGQFVVNATFEPIPSADWFKQNVTIEGGDAHLVPDEAYQYGWAQYLVAEGKEGDTVTL